VSRESMEIVSSEIVLVILRSSSGSVDAHRKSNDQTKR
jgi:hypothetical protein